MRPNQPPVKVNSLVFSAFNLIDEQFLLFRENVKHSVVSISEKIKVFLYFISLYIDYFDDEKCLDLF